MHVEFTFFEWLTLYSQAPWGTVESSTPPRPAPESPWPVWEVWTSFLENCTNASRQTNFNFVSWKLWWIHVEFTFFEWLTLYSRSLRGYGRIVNLPATCTFESLTELWSFNSVFWKLGEWHVEFTFFLVINSLFSSPLGHRRIVNPSTTCSWKSLTCVRSLNFVSWKLYECIETDRQTDRDRQSSL